MYAQNNSEVIDLNRHEFKNPNHLKNDIKKRFDDNTEFAREFTNPRLYNDTLFDNEKYHIEEHEAKKDEKE